MTKSSFFAQLRRCLRWYCTPSETEEVLADYRDFFAAGLAEGKSEAELCEQFGGPEKVVRNLIAGRRTAVFICRLLSAGALLLILAAVYLCLCGLFVPSDSPYHYSHETRDIIGYTAIAVLLPAVLWFLLGGNLTWAPASGQPRNRKKIAGLSCLLLTAVEVMVYGIFAGLITAPYGDNFRFWCIWEIDFNNISRFIYIIQSISALILLLLFFICLLQFVRSCEAIFPLICLLTGAMASLAWSGMTMGLLQGGPWALNEMLWSLVPLGAGCVTAPLPALLLRARKKRAEKEAQL